MSKISLTAKDGNVYGNFIHMLLFFLSKTCIIELIYVIKAYFHFSLYRYRVRILIYIKMK